MRMTDAEADAMYERARTLGIAEGMEKAAQICDVAYSDHFDHSRAKQAARQLAARIRQSINEPSTEGR